MYMKNSCRDLEYYILATPMVLVLYVFVAICYLGLCESSFLRLEYSVDLLIEYLNT